MDAADLLHPLREEPRDAYEWTAAPSQFDSATYRLGLRIAVPVPGLPATLNVGGVSVEVVDGPIRTQRTRLRQRYGLPVVFDKAMSRDLVGDGEQVLLFTSVHTVSHMPTVENAILAWRAKAEGAAGALASVLDERLTGEVLIEDVVLRDGAEVVGAADVRERVRTFLPLEVTAIDRPGLQHLSSLNLEASGVGRAGRLLRRAMLEGPTADAYVMLFVAAESVLESRQPSKKEFDEVLRDAGINPDGLPLHTGLLISLRGKIVHEGLEEHERLATAYYEMEAIVKVLIRRAAAVTGGWWPVQGPASYAPDFDERVHAAPSRSTVWHDDQLPAYTPAADARIPRRVLPTAEPLLADMTAAAPMLEDEATTFIRSVIADALAWVDPDAQPVFVHIGSPPDADVESDLIFNTSDLWIAASRVEGLFDESRPAVLVNLTWDLHGAVGSMAMMRAGVASEQDGVALVEAAGALHQYTRLVVHGEFDASSLNIPLRWKSDAQSAGKLAGWSAAGDKRAGRALKRLRGNSGRVGRAVRDLLVAQQPFPPRPEVLGD